MGVSTPVRNNAARAAGFFLDWTLDLFNNLGPTITALMSNASNIAGTTSDFAPTEVVQSIQSGFNQFTSTILEALKPTGYALCFLFFLIALIELAMSERMTMEFFAKFFSKLAVGYAAVYFSDKIFSICQDMGEKMALFISDKCSTTLNSMETSKSITDVFLEYVSNNGASSWLPLLAIGLAVGVPAVLVAAGVFVTTYIICFSRMLEISIRGMFLPIACSLLSDDGWKGAGGRYIKKFLAVCCQGGILVMIGSLGSLAIREAYNYAVKGIANYNMTGDDGSAVFGLIGKIVSVFIVLIGIGLAIVSLMQKSIGIVNDVFGA